MAKPHHPVQEAIRTGKVEHSKQRHHQPGRDGPRTAPSNSHMHGHGSSAAILKWVKRTISAVDLGAWETSLDTTSLSVDQATSGRQSRKQISRSEPYPDSSRADTASIVSEATTCDTRLASFQNCQITDVAQVVSLPASPGLVLGPRLRRRKSSQTSNEQSTISLGAAAVNNNNSTSSSSNRNNTVSAVYHSHLMRRTQIRHFIESVQRPQSIDLGSDWEVDGVIAATEAGSVRSASVAQAEESMARSTLFSTTSYKADAYYSNSSNNNKQPDNVNNITRRQKQESKQRRGHHHHHHRHHHVVPAVVPTVSAGRSISHKTTANKSHSGGTMLTSN
ncbi:unnamed protein product [Sympodiomycopsis kandeliae]